MSSLTNWLPQLIDCGKRPQSECCVYALNIVRNPEVDSISQNLSNPRNRKEIIQNSLSRIYTFNRSPRTDKDKPKVFDTITLNN